MKMRKKLAALLAAAMIASVMPMTAFAVSSNSVTKTVAYAEDKTLTGNMAPAVKLEIKDEMTSGQAFYLNLENAEWPGDDKLKDYFIGSVNDLGGNSFEVTLDAASRLINNGTSPVAADGKFVFTRTGSKTLRVAYVGTGISRKMFIEIPLYVDLKGGEASVAVDGGESIISSSKHVFATSSKKYEANIKVADPDAFSENGSMASITFDEPFVNAFANELGTGSTTITVELRDNDFEFDIAAKPAKLQGLKGFSNLDTSNIKLAKSGKDLEITIDNANGKLSGLKERGSMELKDVRIVRKDRKAAKGDIEVRINGKFISGRPTFVVAKHTDHATKLVDEAKETEVVMTGQEVEVEFKLVEEVEGSLVENRSIDFELPKGVKFKKDSVEIKKQEDDLLDKVKVTEDDDNQYFTADNFNPDPKELSKYTFEATLLVSNAFEGNEIVLTAVGKALTDTHELVIAKVKKPVDVSVTAMDVKVGLRKQVGGKIVIKENEKDAILRSYTDEDSHSIKDAVIEIRIDDDGSGSGLKITDADIKVTEGDLLLDLDAKVITDGMMNIPVKRQSTKPSTIEITNIELTADRSVPEGKYDIKIGGAALSKNTLLEEFIDDKAFKDDFYEDGNDYKQKKKSDNTSYEKVFMDPVATKEFINITTKNVEDFTGVTAAKVSFVLGGNQYLVNGVAQDMDAAAFVKDGRTMVPVRYVAQALGVSADKVVWDQATQTVTVLAEKVIQVKLGSKTMVINGANVPMTAAAQLVSDRTFVPIAEIARALGVEVVWDDASKTATFN